MVNFLQNHQLYFLDPKWLLCLLLLCQWSRTTFWHGIILQQYVSQTLAFHLWKSLSAQPLLPFNICFKFKWKHTSTHTFLVTFLCHGFLGGYTDITMYYRWLSRHKHDSYVTAVAMTWCSNHIWWFLLPYHHYLLFLPESVASSPENKWFVIVDRASLLLILALSGIQKIQEQCWRLLELHSLKIVSSGIIWVSLQEVGSLISTNMKLFCSD